MMHPVPAEVPKHWDPHLLLREGKVLGQDTFSKNYSTNIMDPKGATTCKLCINFIYP